MGFNITSQDQRQTYHVAKNMLAAANNSWKKDPQTGKQVPDVDETQITQGYLLTMCDINPQQSILQFPIVDTQQIAGAPINPIMRLLSMQDSFIISSMSYSLLQFNFVAGKPNSPDYTAGNFFSPITYVSQFHNNNPLAFPFMAPGMGMFWNGYLSLEVDKKVVIPYWDTQRHFYVPQTQSTMFWNNALTPNQWPLGQDELDGSTDSLFPLEPTIVIGGGRQNLWKLNLPANIPGTIAPFTYAGYGDTFVMKAVLLFRGILLQNSTAVR